MKKQKWKTLIIHGTFFLAVMLFFIIIAYYVFAVPPSQGVPILNSTYGTNGTSENLTVYNISTTDTESDAVKSIYQWYLNNTPIAVAVLPFDAESNGTDTLDFSPLNNTATVNGGIWANNSGYDGFGAYNFTGVSPNNITLANSPSLNITGDEITLEAWVRINGTDGQADATLVSRRGPGPNGVQYSLDVSGGDTTMRLRNSTTAGASVSAVGFIDTLNVWYHIVGTYNKTNMIIYINGVQRAIGSFSGNIVPQNISVRIGEDTGGATLLNGTIDDVRIYNVSLTAEQVLAHYRNRTNTIAGSRDLNRTLLRAGDVWNASVTPIDRSTRGFTNFTTNLTILANASPSHDRPILNSTTSVNTTAENLTVYNVSTVDPDGDAVKNIHNWYRNNTPIALLNVPFEGGSNNTNTTDYSGRNRVVTINGTTITWSATAGADGKGAYVFNGTSPDKMKLSNLPTQTTNGWSVVAWIKPDRFDSKFHVIFGDLCNLNFYFTITDANKIRVSYGNSTGQQKFFDTPVLTSANTWHHVALTVHPNSSVVIYINGTSVASQTVNQGISNTWTTNLHIGSAVTQCGLGYIPNFNGTMDDILFYNMSLTGAQVLALYNNRTNIIDTSMLQIGDTWNASITPNDGGRDGTTKTSTNLTISTAVPTIETPVFNVTTVTKTSGIAANTTYRDGEGIAGNVFFRWFRNNTEVFTENFTSIATATIVNSTLSVNLYNRTDLINVTAWANDSTVNSTINFSATLAVANTLPTQGTPILNSTTGANITTENLTVYNVSSADIDGDGIQNIYNWFRNQVSITIVNMPFENNTANPVATTKDYSPFQNNGTVTGAVFNQAGGFNGRGAYTFDGNDRIVLSNNSMFHISQNVTLMAWINRTGGGVQFAAGIPFDNGAAWDNPFVGLHVGSNGNTARFWINVNATNREFSVDNQIPVNTWRHIALTYDGVIARGFVNGIEVGTSAFPGTINYSSPFFIIGDRSANASGEQWVGRIDDVRLYNRTLSGEQIKAIFDNRSDLLVTNETQVGDTWNASITPNDGSGDGTTITSTNLTSLSSNTAPTIETPVFNVSTVTKTSGIAANTTYRDVDSNAGNVFFRWFRNNTEVFTENFTSIAATTIVNSTLSVNLYNRTDLINVTAWANDSTVNSTINFSTTLTVANTAPTQGTPILNSTRRGNNTDENLTAFNVSVSDPDNDGITTYYEWFNNSRSILNTTTNILSTRNLTGGDKWYVQTIASDLNGNSSASLSANVTINYLNVTLLTPEDSSRRNNANQAFTFNTTIGGATICSLFNNDTGTYRNVTSISSILHNGNNSLTQNNILENSTIAWNIECISPEGSRRFAPANFSLSVDRTLPSMTFNNPIRANTTIFRGQSVPLNLTCDDVGGLFEFQVNITNSTNQSIYLNLTSGIVGTNFNLTPSINFSNNASGTYRVMAECSDDLTKKAIPDYKVRKDVPQDTLAFETDTGANVTIKIIDAPTVLKDVNATKDFDRYTFQFLFAGPAGELPNNRTYIFEINSNQPLIFRNVSSLAHAHFITGSHWIDFQGVRNSGVVFYQNSTGWYARVEAPWAFLNFTSLGGLNQVQENVTFTYDGGFDIANTTNITFTPDPIRQNDRVSFNATFNVSGITNATNLNVTLTVDNIYTAGTTVTITNGTTQQVELNWSSAENGTHTIRINADANNTYTEAFEDNNNATATVTVFNVSILNFSSPSNNAEINRGLDTSSLPGEDTMKRVSNFTTISARVHNRYTTNVGVNSNCTFYFNNTILLGSNQTNSTGECTFTFDHTIYAIGIYNVTVNYTNLNTTSYRADTNSSLIQNTSTIDLGRVLINLNAENQRTGSIYNAGDVAVMNISVTKNGTAFDPNQFTVEVKNPGTECTGTGGILFNHSYPGDISRTALGEFQSFSILEEDTDIHWCVVVNNSAAAPLASATHSDKEVANINANRANFTVINTSDAGDNAVFDDINITLFSSRGNYRIFDRNFTESAFESRVITQNEGYSALFRHNARQEQLNITGLNVTAGNRSLPFNLLPTYSGKLPNNFTNITTIMAFNNSGFTFTSANITIQKANLTVNKIVHCLNWSFTAGNCTGTWEINFTSDYPNFGQNTTHLWFQVNGFTAYAGGNGTNSNITIYDQTDAEGGSITANAGLLTNFTANYTKIADNTAISNGQCNISFTVAPTGPSLMTFDSTKNIYNFTRAFSTAGNFTWNATCGAPTFDQLNASDTIQVVDTIPPNVSSITPITVTSEQSNIFSATVDDFVGVTGCTLFTNNVSDGTMTISGTTATRSKTFSFPGETTVEMYANCTDAAGNINFTRTNVVVEPLRSGGGVGAGTRGVTGAAATAEGFEGGTKYGGLSLGNIILIQVNGVTYTIKIMAIYPNSVRLDVGGVYNVVLLEGLFRNFDINQNGINDVTIYADDVVSYSKVSLTIVTKDDAESTKQQGFFDLGAIWTKIFTEETEEEEIGDQEQAAEQGKEEGPVQEQPLFEEQASPTKQLIAYLNAFFRALREKGSIIGSAVLRYSVDFIAIELHANPQMKLQVLIIIILFVTVPLTLGSYLFESRKQRKREEIDAYLEEEMRYRGLM